MYLLAILIGAALGNVVRGVPLNCRRQIRPRIFHQLQPVWQCRHSRLVHRIGCLLRSRDICGTRRKCLILKTEGPVHDRSLRLAQLWKIVLLLLAIVTIETWQVRPNLFTGMGPNPMAWLGLGCVVVGTATIFIGLKGKRELQPVIGSSLFIAGLMIAGAASVFPIMLYSTLAPDNSLSAYQNAAAGHGLAVALVWWPVSLIFSVGYALFIYRHYIGKVKPSEDTEQPY